MMPPVLTHASTFFSKDRQLLSTTQPVPESIVMRVTRSADRPTLFRSLICFETRHLARERPWNQLIKMPLCLNLFRQSTVTNPNYKPTRRTMQPVAHASSKHKPYSAKQSSLILSTGAHGQAFAIPDTVPPRLPSISALLH